jgi:hypothetical protein
MPLQYSRKKNNLPSDGGLLSVVDVFTSVVDALLVIVAEVLGVITVVTDIVVELFKTEVVLELVTGGEVLSVGESIMLVVSAKSTASVESCAFVSR